MTIEWEDIQFTSFDRALARLIRREEGLDYDVTVHDASRAPAEEHRYSEVTGGSSIPERLVVTYYRRGHMSGPWSRWTREMGDELSLMKLIYDLVEIGRGES